MSNHWEQRKNEVIKLRGEAMTSASSAYALGRLLAEDEKNRDLDEAEHWLMRASEMGSVEADEFLEREFYYLA